MAYSTAADISSEFKDISFTANSSVTESEVTEFIAQADAIINSYVGAKYLLPIAASYTEALSLLKSIEIAIVSTRVGKILKVKSGKAKVDQEATGPTGRSWAMSMLKKIKDCDLLLLDSDGAQLPLVAGGTTTSSNNVDIDLQPTFKRNTDQW